MFCSNCGNKLIDNAKFCNACGTKVVNESTEERKTTYDGEIHKCPNCGDTIDAYETVCEACGYELRGRKAVSVVHELAMKLENTDDTKKKEELIRNFYIPNTKEDIYEFFILATSNIKVGSVDSKAWFAKLEQAYQKAQLTLGHTKEFEYFQTLYIKAERANKTNFIFGLAKSGYSWAMLFCLFGVIMLLLSAVSSSDALMGIGMGAEVAAMWIALMTMINNDNKKKKDKD